MLVAPDSGVLSQVKDGKERVVVYFNIDGNCCVNKKELLAFRARRSETRNNILSKLIFKFDFKIVVCYLLADF